MNRGHGGTDAQAHGTSGRCGRLALNEGPIVYRDMWGQAVQ